MEGQCKSRQQSPERKRGRPAGKNRVPLSKEERRARNAQYEKERRDECVQFMNELAGAVGCNPDLAKADLLATVITYIQQASAVKPCDQLHALQTYNQRLMEQIADLEQRLALEPEPLPQYSSRNFTQDNQYSSQKRKRARCDESWADESREHKKPKTQISDGIDVLYGQLTPSSADCEQSSAAEQKTDCASDNSSLHQPAPTNGLTTDVCSADGEDDLLSLLDWISPENTQEILDSVDASPEACRSLDNFIATYLSF